MDMDGLHWIPSDEWISMESIGQHFCPPQYLSDFRYSFPSWLPVILLPWEGVTNRILPIPSENQVSIGIHWCVLDMHGGRNKGKFDNHLICFNLYSEDSYTKLRNLKHSISRRGSDFGTSYKLFKGFLPYTLGTIKYQSLKKIWIFKSNNWNTQPHEQTSLTMKHNQKLGCSFSEIISSGKLQRTQMESSVWNSDNFL